MAESNTKASPYGILAEYDTPGAVLHAAEKIRDAGFKRWDCYTPFPVHGLDRAMGLRDTHLPWLVLIAGATGFAVAMGLQWFTNAYDYPIVISGKPLFSLPANIPVAFELTVLFAAISAFAGMFALNQLPQFYHPGFRNKRFRRVTSDRFFIAIETADPRFSSEKTEALLRSTGTSVIEWLED